MKAAGRSSRSGVVAAILSLIIATIIFAALRVPIQIEATLMSPAYLLIGAAFNAFCSATIVLSLATVMKPLRLQYSTGYLTTRLADNLCLF